MSDSEMKEERYKCALDSESACYAIVGYLFVLWITKSGDAVWLFDMKTFVGLLCGMQTRTEGWVYHIGDMCEYVSEWGWSRMDIWTCIFVSFTVEEYGQWVASAKAEVRANSGRDVLRQQRNSISRGFPKTWEWNATKCEGAWRSFAKHEDCGEGAKWWESCLEVGNDGKRRGMISEGFLKESIKGKDMHIEERWKIWVLVYRRGTVSSACKACTMSRGCTKM
jgi:hypothetical protein